MTQELCEKKKKLSDVDESKLKPSETSDQKTFRRIRYAAPLEKRVSATKRGMKRFVKMRIAARVSSTFPYNSTRFLVLIVMLSIIADKGVAK